MTNVYYTWFGPTQSASTKIKEVHGLQRKDLFGIMRTAPLFRLLKDVNFTLCVLEKYKDDFDTDLQGSGIKTLAVDSYFTDSNYHSLILTKPDLKDLDKTVGYIFQQILNVRGKGYDTSALEFKKLAFAKDLWSLYCIWKFGGYHLDSGVFPLEGHGVRFPEPKDFCVPAVGHYNPEKIEAHYRFNFSTGKSMCVTTGNSDFLPLKFYAMKGRCQRIKQVAHIGRTLDVWLMRSPAGNESVKTALKVYVQGWFEIDQWIRKGEIGDIQGQHRDLIISSVMTGLSHSGRHHKCSSNKSKIQKNILDGFDKRIKELGLRKVGFQSHR